MTTSKNTATEWKALALKATKGPWCELHNMAGPMGIVAGTPDSERIARVCWLEIGANEHANAAFIAASSPERVIELLEEVERHRRLLQTTVNTIEVQMPQAVRSKQDGQWFALYRTINAALSEPSEELYPAVVEVAPRGSARDLAQGPEPLTVPETSANADALRKLAHALAWVAEHGETGLPFISQENAAVALVALRAALAGQFDAGPGAGASQRKSEGGA